MKKTLCLLLTALVLLTAVPMAGFAEGGTDAEQAAAGKVCKIGDVYYDTLHAALKAVQDGETITLISDLTQKDRFVESGNASVVSPGITFTLNGNGHTVTRPAKDTSGALFGDVSNNFVFDNCKLDLQGDWGGGQLFRALKPAEAMTISFRDCDVKLNNALVGEPLDAGKKLELSFINTTVTQSAKRSNGFLPDFNSGQDVTVTLDHSTLNLMAGKLWTTHNAVGRLILKNGSHLNTLGGVTPITCWGDAGENNRQSIVLYDSEIRMSDESEYRAKDYSALLNWTGGFMSLKLDGKSAIRTNRTNAATGQTKGMYLVRVNVNTNMTVELEKGAVIEMNDCGVKDKSGLVWFEGNGKIGLVDRGATWHIGKELLACGIRLNALSVSQIGWATEGKLYAPETVVTDAQATEGAVFAPITLGEANFGMVPGAATRTEDSYGLRFNAWVSADFRNRLTASGVRMETGFVVAETEKVIGNFLLSGMATFDYEIYEAELSTEETDGAYRFRKALYGFSDDKEALTRRYSAMAYLKLLFADGTTRTIYTDYDAGSHARSAYDVAKKAIEAGITGRLLGHIVSVAEA